MTTLGEHSFEDKEILSTGRPGRTIVSKLLHLLGPKNPASRTYRFLARQIDAEMGAIQGGRVIAVSSLSSMALNNDTLLMFAYFMQHELGCRILLVDGAFRDGGISSRLGYSDSRGLTDLMRQANPDVLSHILPTTHRDISILPAGKSPQENGMALRLSAVRPLLANARELYDYIFIQQGSILRDTRYLLFARLADLVMLLVEDGSTRLSEVEECRKLMSSYQIANYRMVVSKSG